jgi:SPP1 family predicted phage head-tail adaptor
MRAIGRLDRKIVIQSLSISQGDFGEVSESFSATHTVWAMVNEKKGKESEVNEKQIGINKVVFTIRHIDNLNIRMRVSYDGRLFDIEHIEHGHANRDDMIILHTEEIV